MNDISTPKPQETEQESVQISPFLKAAEGYYVGALLQTLHLHGVLRQLEEPHTVAAIADSTDIDASILGPILAFLSSSGDCVTYDARQLTYRTNPAYFESTMATHILDQYIGAYGPCLTALEATKGQSLVDRDRHAAAFENASGAPNDLLQLILGLTPDCVLDLGCGNAGLLKSLIAADNQIHAIGIDASAAMLALAQQDSTLKETSNLKLICGDVLDTVEALPDKTRDQVDVIIAQSLANEFFWYAHDE